MMADEPLTDTITRLLAASRAAHARALTARQQKQADLATTELTAARDLRLEAHAADPEHTVALWGAEVPTHASMMAFYSHKLGA